MSVVKYNSRFPSIPLVFSWAPAHLLSNPQILTELGRSSSSSAYHSPNFPDPVLSTPSFHFSGLLAALRAVLSFLLDFLQLWFDQATLLTIATAPNNSSAPPIPLPAAPPPTIAARSGLKKSFDFLFSDDESLVYE